MDRKKIIKHLAIAVAFFIVACVVFALLDRQIRVNHEKFIEYEKEWSIEQKRKDQMLNLDTAIDNLGEKIEQIDSHFAIGADIAPFLDSLEKLGAPLGVEAEVISVNENKRTEESRETLSVGLRATGNFDQMYKFFKLLESFSYEIDFDLIDLDKRGATGVNDDNSSWQAFFRIKLISFISQPDEDGSEEN